MSAGEFRPAEAAHVLTDLGQNVLTLEPLRTHGPDALSPAGIQSIAKVTLQKIACSFDNAFHETSLIEADDVFRCIGADCADQDPLPDGASPVYAFLVIQFTDSPDPRTLEIRPPTSLNLQSQTDMYPVFCWLSKSGFIISAHGSPEGSFVSNAQSLEVS